MSLCPLELIHTHLCSGGRYYPLPSDHSKAGGTLGFITCPKRQFNALTAGVSGWLHNLLSHARKNPAGERAHFFNSSAVLCADESSCVFICFRLHSNILTGCHSFVQVNLIIIIIQMLGSNFGQFFFVSQLFNM